MRRKIIITGAGGFIGRYLVRKFLDCGDEVYSIVRKECSVVDDFFKNNRHIVLKSDLEELTVGHFPAGRYDAFFHLGWHGVNRKEIDDDSIHKNNFDNAKRCLAISEKLGCTAFLDVGTRAEYGAVKGKYVESLPCQPETAYGREKLRFYQYAYNHTQISGQQYLHFRIFSVIGVEDHPWSLISTACNFLKAGKLMEMGACEQLWNFLDVRDAVSAMLLAYESIDCLKTGDNRIVNIAGYDTRVLRSFIEEIRIITASSSKLVFDQNKKSEDVVPDISKLTLLTGWHAKYMFADTIREILTASR